MPNSQGEGFSHYSSDGSSTMVDVSAKVETLRVAKAVGFVKGGAWITTEILDLRPAARGNSGHINNPSSFYGFRCVI